MPARCPLTWARLTEPAWAVSCNKGAGNTRQPSRSSRPSGRSSQRRSSASFPVVSTAPRRLALSSVRNRAIAEDTDYRSSGPEYCASADSTSPASSASKTAPTSLVMGAKSRQAGIR